MESNAKSFADDDELPSDEIFEIPCPSAFICFAVVGSFYERNMCVMIVCVISKWGEKPGLFFSQNNHQTHHHQPKMVHRALLQRNQRVHYISDGVFGENSNKRHWPMLLIQRNNKKRSTHGDEVCIQTIFGTCGRTFAYFQLLLSWLLLVREGYLTIYVFHNFLFAWKPRMYNDI